MSSQPVSAPLVDARSPSCIVVESSRLTARFPLCKPRPCRSLARGGACHRAQPSRLRIAALPLLPTKDARIAMFVHDAPRTTQLYYHAEGLRPHVVARRYHSLRVSPALHQPERSTSLAASLIGHASQHALPRRRGERRSVLYLRLSCRIICIRIVPASLVIRRTTAWTSKRLHHLAYIVT